MRRVYGLLYRAGITPWDSALIPGPLAGEIQAAAPGTAVDLGCGTGRQARYLAANGWSVTAVDFVPRALDRAAAADRARPGGRTAAGTVTWRLADVTRTAEVDPDRTLARRVSLILDNGCLHGIPSNHNPGTGRNGWARTIEHLAAPGCVLLLRAIPARRRTPNPAGTGRSGTAELLGGRWHLTSTPAPGWSRFTLDPE